MKTKVMKICSKCKEEKPLSDFTKNKFCTDGLNPWCKTCAREYRQLPEVKEQARQYRQKTEVKEKHRQYAQQRYHRPEVKAWHKIWYLDLKIKALSRIAKLICKLCGDTNIKKLCIDHWLGDGDAHRIKLFGNKRTAGTPFYRWILKSTDKEIKDANLRILCISCNNGTKINTDSQWKIKIKKS